MAERGLQARSYSPYSLVWLYFKVVFDGSGNRLMAFSLFDRLMETADATESVNPLQRTSRR